MGNVNVTHVLADDWYGLYVDEKLISEGHSFNKDELPVLFEALALEIEFVSEEADLDWQEKVLMWGDGMPPKLRDVPLR